MTVENLELKPRITVIGVGGAGGNAVSNMINAKLEGVEFVVANTDAQALSESSVEPTHKIQLGLHVTQGLGAGSKPDVGRASDEESQEEIIQHLRGSNMVFITAGMGGGTGTGAAPVIARAAREEGILTVGVVTKPFHFEGTHRSRTAERGIEELQQFVDTLIIIPNQNLFRIANERTTFADAFKMADDVLYSGVRGVTDLMMMPGLINLDFADIRAVMAEMGKAMMGTGEAEGDRRALDAAEAAISNPLLDDVSMKGAKGVLINITGGYDMTLYEVDEAANRIRDEVDPEANIIFGSTFDEKLNGTIRVSVVATGIGGGQPQIQTASGGASSPVMARPINMAAGSAGSTRESVPSQSVYFGPESQSTETPAVAEHEKSSEHEAIAVPPTAFHEDTESAKHSDLTGSEGHSDSSPDLGNNFGEEKELSGLEATPNLFQDLESSASASEPTKLEQKVNTPSLDEKLSPEIGEEKPRRPTSLFERFTGVSRAKGPQPQPELTKVPEEEKHEELDMLEIPAFLRRGN